MKSLHSYTATRQTFWAVSLLITFLQLVPIETLSQPARYGVKRISGISGATGINNKRQVSGTRIVGGTSQYAVRWENGVVTQYPGVGGGNIAAAMSINNQGEMAGYAYDSDFIGHAVVFKPDGTMRLLSSEIIALAYGISDRGDVVGANRFCETCQMQAALWRGQSITDLGTLGNNGSVAVAVSDSGLIVGVSEAPPLLQEHAFMTAGVGLVDLGTLGGNRSAAYRVNNNGMIVGAARDASDAERAVIWNPGIANIQTLAGTSSRARGVNNANQVVGTVVTSTGNTGFLWENGVMKDLNTLISPDSGWVVGEAIAINDFGDILCLGTKNNVSSYIILGKPLQITHPARGVRWIGGIRDTIRWNSLLDANELIDIEYSLDDGATWNTVQSSYRADSLKYVWTMPDTFSTKARILISSVSDFTINDTSGIFTMRNYQLLRRDPQNDYEAFAFGKDWWQFGNTQANMWPISVWSVINYQSGIDPYTNSPYPQYYPYPFKDALSFQSPSWPLFVRAFGIAQCYFGMSHRPSATMKWEAKKKKWAGSCSGFAISSLLAFDNPSTFRTGFPEMPPYNNLFNVALGDSVRQIINSLWIHWFGEQHKQFVAGVSGRTPTQTVQDLKAALGRDRQDNSYLYISGEGPSGNGAHAIVPYKIWQDTASPNLYRIFVYDNSHNTAANAVIIVDTTGNSGDGTWSYALWPGWGKKLYLMDSSSTYLTPPILSDAPSEMPVAAHMAGSSALTLFPTLGAFVRITDNAGYAIGFVDSVVVDSMPGAVPLTPPTGSFTPPYSYLLPAAEYSVVLDHLTDSLVSVSIFADSTIVQYSRRDGSANQDDKLRYIDGLSTRNSNASPKRISIQNVVVEQAAEKALAVSNYVLTPNDSVLVRVENHDRLKVMNVGVQKTYDLDLLRASESGAPRFAHPGIALAANSTHHVTPNWANLQTVTIYVDLGNNGTIDDTIYVANTVSVEERGGVGIPVDFSLAQNYPNPFNPTTTFKYDLPAARRVTLIVYNVLGQEVARLIDDYKQAGRYSVKWDASAFASGVYFYQLRAGDFVASRKLVLLR